MNEQYKNMSSGYESEHAGKDEEFQTYYADKLKKDALKDYLEKRGGPQPVFTVKEPHDFAWFQKIGRPQFGNALKAVVDIEKGVMEVIGEPDIELSGSALIHYGSKQQNLRKVNIILKENDFVLEFSGDSGEDTVDQMKVADTVRSLIIIEDKAEAAGSSS